MAVKIFFKTVNSVAVLWAIASKQFRLACGLVSTPTPYRLALYCLLLSGSNYLWAGAKVVPQRLIQNPCVRGVEGSPATEPLDLRSKNGVLKAQLAMRNSLDANGHMRYCYVDEHGNQAPTLRVQPGDTL